MSVLPFLFLPLNKDFLGLSKGVASLYFRLKRWNEWPYNCQAANWWVTSWNLVIKSFGVLLCQPWASFYYSLEVSIWCIFRIFLLWNISGAYSIVALVREAYSMPIYWNLVKRIRGIWCFKHWYGISLGSNLTSNNIYYPFHYLMVVDGMFHPPNSGKIISGCTKLLGVSII